MTDGSPARNAALGEEFRRRPMAAREEIARALVTTDEELATLEAHPAGALSEATGTETAAGTRSCLEGQERHELDEIEDALTRLESGSFGLCQTCARSIPLACLRVTRHWIDCARRLLDGDRSRRTP